MSFMKVFLLLIIFCNKCLNHDENKKNSLSVVPDSEPTDNEVTVDEEPIDANDVKPFVATNKWQTINEGQLVPAGLHVRINLETGLKEAKLMDDTNAQQDDDHKTQTFKKAVNVLQKEKSSGQKPVLTKEEIKEALKNMHLDVNKKIEMNEKKIRNKFKSIEEIKKQFDEVNVEMKSETEIMSTLINNYGATKSVDEKVHILNEMEFLVHQFDVANDFVTQAGVQLLIPDLNSTSNLLRAQVAFTIGSAMQGNPRVQREVLESGALHTFLRLLTHDPSNVVKLRVLFAVSCLVRQFPYAQKLLVESGGLSVFAALFKQTGIESIKLSVKVITLLNDLLMEQDLTRKYSKRDDKNMQEKLRQYASFNLNDALLSQGFCDLVPRLLISPDQDVKEKVIQAMNSMLSLCRNEFKKSLPILQLISNQFNEMSKDEINSDSSDDYFIGLYHNVIYLINNINGVTKDEL